jgi:hypothetical protein
MDERQSQLRTLFQQADPEVQTVVLKVFGLEEDKLYMGLPRGIIEEIVDAIKQVVT